MLDEATSEVESKSLEKFINSRTRIDIRSLGPNNINPGRIAIDANQLYNSNKIRYRHGKKVMNYVKSKLQRIVGGDIEILVPSVFVKSESLHRVIDPVSK